MNLNDVKRLLPGNRVTVGGKAGVICSIGYGQESDGEHFVRVVVNLDDLGGRVTLTGNMTRQLERESVPAGI